MEVKLFEKFDGAVLKKNFITHQGRCVGDTAEARGLLPQNDRP